MGGGNGQKSAMKRAKKLEQDQAANKGSQLKQNAAAMNLKCAICLQTFVCTTAESLLRQHAENKHPKNDFFESFPHLKS